MGEVWIRVLCLRDHTTITDLLQFQLTKDGRIPMISDLQALGLGQFSLRTQSRISNQLIIRVIRLSSKSLISMKRNPNSRCSSLPPWYWSRTLLTMVSFQTLSWRRSPTQLFHSGCSSLLTLHHSLRTPSQSQLLHQRKTHIWPTPISRSTSRISPRPCRMNSKSLLSLLQWDPSSSKPQLSSLTKTLLRTCSQTSRRC